MVQSRRNDAKPSISARPREINQLFTQCCFHGCEVYTPHREYKVTWVWVVSLASSINCRDHCILRVLWMYATEEDKQGYAIIPTNSSNSTTHRQRNNGKVGEELVYTASCQSKISWSRKNSTASPWPRRYRVYHEGPLPAIPSTSIHSSVREFSNSSVAFDKCFAEGGSEAPHHVLIINRLKRGMQPI